MKHRPDYSYPNHIRLQTHQAYRHHQYLRGSQSGGTGTGDVQCGFVQGGYPENEKAGEAIPEKVGKSTGAVQPADA